ncbi:MAG: FKBP-type peptidyl-prolyl cis-trans isomerase [Fluviicola sp.]
MSSKWLYIALLFGVVSCSDTEKEDPENKQPINWDAEKSSDFNRGLSDKEADDIQLYLEMRPNWKMTKTGSGLQYWIYTEGEGATPEPNDIAEIEYEISLLNGEVCYKTEDDEYEEVRVDRSEIESGIQEALKLLQVGDEAKLIIPSHLGQGLLGDFDKIPPLKTLVVDIKLIGIKKK